MLPDVITPFTTTAEWYAQRSRIRRVFLESLGIFPAGLSTRMAETAGANWVGPNAPPSHAETGAPLGEASADTAARGAPAVPADALSAAVDSVPPVPSVETSRKTEDGFTRVEFRYQVVGDYWTDAVLLSSTGFDESGAVQRPIVLTIHGSNRERGKYSLMDPESRPNRTYVSELARRGFITVAPDQFGFGPDSREIGQDALFERFFSDYPDWSLDGIRLASHMRLIDLLSSEQFLSGSLGGRSEDAEGRASRESAIHLGAIGNSLGGRAVIHLAAVDERVAAAVVSTGISPNYSNVYRHIKRPGQIKSPRLTEKLATDGIPPWDFQHLISLCAPRSILIVEPWFDPYNPDTPGAMSCAAKAAQVYRLVGRPEGLRLLVHGDGHDTTDATRDYAYGFLEEGLGQ